MHHLEPLLGDVGAASDSCYRPRCLTRIDGSLLSNDPKTPNSRGLGLLQTVNPGIGVQHQRFGWNLRHNSNYRPSQQILNGVVGKAFLEGRVSLTPVLCCHWEVTVFAEVCIARCRNECLGKLTGLEYLTCAC